MISEAALPDPTLKGLRILLVEDEAMVAMLIESILDDLGCLVVECAASVPAALEAIDSRQFDGALLDMNLGGSTVYPVAEILSARALPFAFVSGYGPTADVEARFPNVAVLKKPFDAWHLAQLVKTEIALRLL